MLPVVLYTKRKIFKSYCGFSFFIFIWIYDPQKKDSSLIRHEKIHFLQQLELLFIFHWLLYGLFYVAARLAGHNHDKSYRSIPFEREAYAHEDNINYLNDRVAFSWVRYCVP
ncbi:hypothetical protein [Pseudochryseolinea flava]|uniref:DUF4157 domain-containing protein n=1 Tax=Pseudochryseolinea flava TaxID=2059302 RepID=A0A364Y1D1_9BACT|nr:hypothetical protein [Pseudochryseolinea flava]RAW00083.1 hypothetical protein DQQ10_16165 [Pseudochryseolinea flava]